MPVSSPLALAFTVLGAVPDDGPDAEDPALDRLTRLAARLLGAPGAILLLGGGDRPLIGSVAGPLAGRIRSRDLFALAPLYRRVMAGRQAVVASVPAAGPRAAAPAIAAFLGVSLRATTGEALGALCVADSRPRRWGRDAAEIVEALAAAAAREIELRHESAARRGGDALLRAEAACFRESFERAAAPMGHLALDGTWLRVNPALCALLGYGERELMAVPLHGLGHPDDAGIDTHARDAVVRGAADAYRGERRLVRHDGQPVWVRETMSLVRTARGTPAYVIVGAEDVSEQRAAQEVLARRLSDRQRAESWLRCAHSTLATFANAAPFAIVTTDAECVVLSWNGAATTMFGWTADEVIGRPLPMVPPDGRAEVEAWSRAVLRGQTLSGVETRRRHKDGTLIDVLLAIAPLRGVDEQVDGMVHFLIDVTERRRLADQLRQAAKMEAVGRLAGGVAHDFNNLLTVIGCHAAFLCQEVGGAAAEDVEQIRRAAERASGLTAQLLAFSRKQMLQPRVLDLNTVVDELDPLLRRLIGEDVEIVTTLSAERPLVRADPNQLEQVLVNLAVNARDAMPDGGVLLIETSLAAVGESERSRGLVPGAYATISVTDTGVGMDDATRAQIFEPFFTTKARGAGTGLGLSTVYGIVTQSGGAIDVQSEPRRGTTFRILLPLAGTPETDPVVGPSTEAPRGSETILVAEDEDAVRALVCRILRRQGYQVLDARRGGEALDLAAAAPGRIDLLLTDVVMPEMNGLALAERLTAERPETRVLYVSGYTDDDIIRCGLIERETALLHKPFTAAQLACKIREVLDRPR